MELGPKSAASSFIPPEPGNETAADAHPVSENGQLYTNPTDGFQAETGNILKQLRGELAALGHLDSSHVDEGSDPHFDHVELNWGDASLPQQQSLRGNRLAIGPQETFLREYVAYWRKNGAIALDPNDVTDAHVLQDMRESLSREVRNASRGLEGGFPDSAMLDGENLSYSVALPRHPKDLGLGTHWNRRITSTSDTERVMRELRKEDRLARVAPLQFKLLNQRNGVETYSILASIRSSNGDSTGFFSSTLMPMVEPGDRMRALFDSSGYRPFVATELRVHISTKPEERHYSAQLRDYVWQHNVPPVVHMNILYSARAFEIARDALIREGMEPASGAPVGVQTHMVRTIRATILEYLRNGNPKLGVSASSLNYLRDGDHPQTVDSIVPMGNGDPNQFKVFCSCGSKQFVFRVDLHIWFPGKDELSRRLSNRYDPDPKNESPFLLRCAHDILTPRDQVDSRWSRGKY